MAKEALSLPVRAPGILFIETWDCRHLAMVRFAAQPAKESALQMPGVEPVGFSQLVLAGDGDARRVDDEGLDATRPQPAR